MRKVLDYGLEVREFELQSRYYVHFRTNSFGESHEPTYVLNSISDVLLQGWFWH